MRALVVRAPGPPSVLRLEDVPHRDPGRREVRIAVAACGVCFDDVVTRNGIFRQGVVMRFIPGHEVAGVIEKLGADVAELGVGDRVGPRLTAMSAGVAGSAGAARSIVRRRRIPGRCGVNGGYAEYVCVDADAAVRLPDGIEFEGSSSPPVRSERSLTPSATSAASRSASACSSPAPGRHWTSRYPDRAAGRRVRHRGDDQRGEGGRYPHGRSGRGVVVARGEDFSAAARRIAGAVASTLSSTTLAAPSFPASERASPRPAASCLSVRSTEISCRSAWRSSFCATRRF